MAGLYIQPGEAANFLAATKRYVPRVLGNLTDSTGMIRQNHITKEKARDLFDTLQAFFKAEGDSVHISDFEQFYLRDVGVSCALGFLPPHLADNFKNWQTFSQPVAGIAKFNETLDDSIGEMQGYCDMIEEGTDWSDGDDGMLEDFSLVVQEFFREGRFSAIPTESLPDELDTRHVYKAHEFAPPQGYTHLDSSWINGKFFVLQDRQAKVLDVIFQENVSGRLLKSSQYWADYS